MKYSLLVIALLLAGCSSKPEIITKIEYQTQYIPIRCNVEIPQKPEYNRLNLQSAKELIRYYKILEGLLYVCVRGE